MKNTENKIPWTIFVLFVVSPFILFLLRPALDLPAGIAALTPFDWFTYGLYWICAFLILRQIRFVWLLCVFLLAISVMATGIQAFWNFNDSLFLPLAIQFLISFGLMCILIITIQYFNQGLFDKRDRGSILGIANRKGIKTLATLTDPNGKLFKANVLSLSISGAFIELLDTTPDPHYLLRWQIDIPDYGVKGQEFQFVEIANRNQVRIQFDQINLISAWSLYRKLKST